MPVTAAGRPCRQPRRAGRAGSHRGPAVPAAEAGRSCQQPPLTGRAGSRSGQPCRQPPRTGRAGSCRGPAGPAAAAGRAGSRGPTCAGQTIGHKLRSQDASIEEPAGNCISFRQPTLPEEGGGIGVGGRGGTCELGLRSLPSEARAVADLSPHARAAGHGPAHPHCGSVARVRAERRACARAERRACVRAR